MKNNIIDDDTKIYYTRIPANPKIGSLYKECSSGRTLWNKVYIPNAKKYPQEKERSFLTRNSCFIFLKEYKNSYDSKMIHWKVIFEDKVGWIDFNLVNESEEILYCEKPIVEFRFAVELAKEE